MTGRDPAVQAAIIRADARNLPLPDASVDLIATSPPYWGLRDYRDGDTSLAGQIGAEATPGEYVDALLESTREWMRVLKPSGSMFVLLGDKYATSGGHGASATSTRADRRSHQAWEGRAERNTTGAPAKSLLMLPERYRIGCVDRLGLIARAVTIWSKPNGLPESVTDRVRRSHEDWVHLVKQPRYYAAVDEIREPHSLNTHARRKDGRLTDKQRRWNELTPVAHGHDGLGGSAKNPLGRLPGSVWEVPTQPLRAPGHLDVDHFAAFPPALIRRIVLGWCPPAGLVLDPFGGTGTTALVASMHGRHGISVDRSADYCRLAQWRVNDPAERARALGVPAPPPVPDGQMTFEVTA